MVNDGSGTYAPDIGLKIDNEHLLSVMMIQSSFSPNHILSSSDFFWKQYDVCEVTSCRSNIPATSVSSDLVPFSAGPDISNVGAPKKWS